MVGRTQTPRDCRTPCRILACAVLLAAAASVVRAQPCTAPLPDPSVAQAADRTTKFGLIARQCPGLAGPAQVHRARQLDLYDHAPSVTIRMPGASAPAAGAPAVPPPPAEPLGREGMRVVSLAPAVTAAARAHDIDPLLLHAIAHVESRHDTRAVSAAGARGVMQVMPATAQRLGVGDPERSLFDATTNLGAAAALLRTLRSRYGDDLRLVLAAYNAGEGAVDKHGGTVPPYPETQAYVRDVLALYRRLSSMFTVSASGALVARGEQS